MGRETEWKSGGRFQFLASRLQLRPQKPAATRGAGATTGDHIKGNTNWGLHHLAFSLRTGANMCTKGQPVLPFIRLHS